MQTLSVRSVWTAIFKDYLCSAIGIKITGEDLFTPNFRTGCIQPCYIVVLWLRCIVAGVAQTKDTDCALFKSFTVFDYLY